MADAGLADTGLEDTGLADTGLTDTGLAEKEADRAHGTDRTYSIGEVSEMFDLPISTLRYYDKEGLFPNLARSGGIRRFGQTELGALRVIECLKKSGLPIKDIKQFMAWCEAGPEAFGDRRRMFDRQKVLVEGELAELRRVLDVLTFKSWYYEQCEVLGDEARVLELVPDGMPDDVRRAYERSWS